MRGSRTKDEQKVSVIEAKINAPDITYEEIEDKTGVPVSTVWDILNKDLPEVRKGSENIINLIDRNNNLQSAADALIAEMVANKDKSITVAQLTSLRDSTFKQNQVIEMWKAGKEDSKTIIIQI